MKGYGLTIFMLLCVACTQQNIRTEHTFYTFTQIDQSKDEQGSQLIKRYESLRPPALPTGEHWMEDWVFMMGKPDEGLLVKAISIEGDLVNLPHGMDKPDRAFWYRKQIAIPDSGFFYIRADDGAQLFVNGQQIFRQTDNFFPVIPGEVEVTVRVLNNAMRGGLHSVSFITLIQYDAYKNELKNYLQLKQNLEKLILFRNKPPELFQLVSSWMANNSTPNYEALSANLSDYPFITGPWLQRTDKGGFIIKAWTDNLEDVVLHYGYKPHKLEYNMIRAAGISVFELPEALPSDTVYYQLTTAKTKSPVYHFYTRESNAFSFSVWADSQSGWNVFRENIKNTLPYNDIFSVGVGDLVGNGADQEEWRMFFTTLSASSPYRPYYLIPGNHDYDGYYDNLIPAFYRSLIRDNEPWQFWSYGNCAFIALDANERFPIGVPEGSEQWKWFHQQLQSVRWKSATWRFVLLHQPPYSQGWPGYEGDQVIRDLLEPVIKSAKIDFVISGHTHDYEHLTKKYGDHNTTYLIVGGAGGSLEPPESSHHPKMDTVIKAHHIGRFHVNGNKLRFEVLDLNGSLLDFIECKK